MFYFILCNSITLPSVKITKFIEKIALENLIMLYLYSYILHYIWLHYVMCVHYFMLLHYINIIKLHKYHYNMLQ